ncbi:hypothetical protein NSE01_37710 [Novosphingobium sediminis]|uniref:Uncharacterized protein n=1 Tax=Novosphingobium sediminis TaxID=707214 RepID=A0A512AQD8_9SPHN|nr:hypothetical protein NSE01_37710 [Novosphingobium sediminis]
MQPLDPAIGFEGPKPRLDRRQKIGFDDRESLAHLSVVGGADCRGGWPSGKRGKAEREDKAGPPPHSSASPVPTIRSAQTKPIAA